MRALRISVILLTVILISCDKGLSPNPEEGKTGFGGTITFNGDWNPSVKQTNVVVFQNPLLTVADFNIFNLKFVSESIPHDLQIYNYTTENENSILSTIDAGLISYIAVAQSEKDTLSLSREDSEIVGLYYAGNDRSNPGSIIIPETTYVDSINIHCDFNNPPQQPPGGETFSNLINAILDDSKNIESFK